ncbi:hypothetical protein IPV08_16850 [Methylobacterium sp. SD274]|uniref:hypothetical protein n=1 Tax=Methylobacterium sp. SD274 TaxID=2782009 RepID=UPI001A967E10|nr:hypothetical protein [Methylobacterium sp. SD274]MBO1021631.1 hypothetical protein [Methylobacterium sp. SD274]
MTFHSRTISWSMVLSGIRSSGPSKDEFNDAMLAESAAKRDAGRVQIAAKHGLVTGSTFNVPTIMSCAIVEARKHRRNDPTLTWGAAISRALRFFWACATAARRLVVPAVAPVAPMPAALRRGVLGRAWELFRSSYGYPRVPFRSLGWGCFTCALKRAWSEARETVRLAGLGIEALKAADAIEPRVRVGLSTSYTDSIHEVVARNNAARLRAAAMAYAPA